ncbi:unnamed protein product [Lactuca saligna]|uniref:Uncharacterized protein n=1 Tax=Lactuca saligna TaxID=75948 RepID=A0AA35YL61_LACSI|nr:unnamed protein product [Lactuca saligna]
MTLDTLPNTDIKGITALVDDDDDVTIEENPPSSQVNDDQPILDVDDQSEADDYKGFLDLDCMPQTVIPLSVVYPDVNPRLRKVPILGGANDVEARSSSAAGVSSVTPPKKYNLIVDLEDLAEDWKITFE